MMQLPAPPKFGPGSVKPLTDGDWFVFYRWLSDAYQSIQLVAGGIPPSISPMVPVKMGLNDPPVPVMARPPLPMPGMNSHEVQGMALAALTKPQQPQKRVVGDVLTATLAADYSLTTGFSDIGVSVTTDQDGSWLVTSMVEYDWVTPDGALQVQLLAAGSAQAGVIESAIQAKSFFSAQWYVVTVPAGSILKLQAKKASGAGTSSLISANTRLVALLVQS